MASIKKTIVEFVADVSYYTGEVLKWVCSGAVIVLIILPVWIIGAILVSPIWIPIAIVLGIKRYLR